MHISVRAMVSICCSPPDRNPARRSRSVASLGKSCHAASTVQRPARCAALLRDLEVLAHREVREHAPVLRNEADAGARDPVGAPALDRIAFPAHASLRGRH